MRALALAIVLLTLWLAMSGIYKPLLISLGVVSTLLCVFIVRRLGVLQYPTPGNVFGISGIARYIGWLIVEIGRADWAITKVILSRDLPKAQSILKVPSRQRSELAKALFANSITITPGTITVETEPEYFVVHALTPDAADREALDAMGSRICAIERPDAAVDMH